MDYLVDRLDEQDRNILEAASIAGMHFSAAEVAAALEVDMISVERRCETLARQG